MKDSPLIEAERARLQKVFASIPYVRLLGIEFVDAARGSARFALEMRDDLTRNGGLMHGGAVASLLDTAAAFAVMTLLEPGQRTVTVDLTIHFLRPVLRGRIEAQARVLRAGRRVATLTIDAKDQDEKLTATATTTYLIMNEPTP